MPGQACRTARGLAPLLNLPHEDDTCVSTRKKKKVEKETGEKLPPTLYINSKIINDPNITAPQLRAYLLICTFSVCSGRCYAPTTRLKQSAGWVHERQLSAQIKALHEKKYIWREMIHKKSGGSLRNLVPRCHHKKYVEHLKSKGYFNKAAEVHCFFQGGDKEEIAAKFKEFRYSKGGKYGRRELTYLS